ncbi:MAG: Xaa-Pro peptidase family protein [Bryobacteraceae bacterium]
MTRAIAVFAICMAAASAATLRPFNYDYVAEAARAAKLDVDHLDPTELRRTYAARRERVMQAMPGGALLVFSVEQPQARRLEFQVPHSENHDFVYLTGVDGMDSLDSAILLIPTPGKNWEILYSSGDLEAIRQSTGIQEVRAFSRLEEDFSVALTDYRDWRITQIRRWPVPAALAKAWGPDHKVLWANYPRFLRLRMPQPPRVEFFNRLKSFSADLEMHDSADVLDPVRMMKDGYDLACLRRAVEITGEGIQEGLRAVRPGMTENQVMELMDFVYRYRGAYLGFPTSVHRNPPGGRGKEREIPEGFIEFVPRSSESAIQAEDIIHVDTGASFRHNSADIQRNVPVGGKFSPQQRRLYEIALNVQKTVISKIKPGVTWWELHNLAVKMLKDAGGYDEGYTYGIGHYIGMEVHDEGDYDQPMKAGMVLSIEQGVNPKDGPRVAFEDNVIVTPEGHDWISRSIPIEIDEVEAMAKKKSSLDGFVAKPK